MPTMQTSYESVRKVNRGEIEKDEEVFESSIGHLQ